MVFKFERASRGQLRGPRMVPLEPDLWLNIWSRLCVLKLYQPFCHLNNSQISETLNFLFNNNSIIVNSIIISHFHTLIP